MPIRGLGRLPSPRARLPPADRAGAPASCLCQRADAPGAWRKRRDSRGCRAACAGGATTSRCVWCVTKGKERERLQSCLRLGGSDADADEPVCACACPPSSPGQRAGVLGTRRSRGHAGGACRRRGGAREAHTGPRPPLLPPSLAHCVRVRANAGACLRACVRACARKQGLVEEADRADVVCVCVCVRVRVCI